ncbi:MAG: SRPBCC family protein [Thermoplasmata archaeon]
MHVEGDRATLVFRRLLNHPPESVWESITNPARLRTWFVAEAKIDGRVGGSFEMVKNPYHLHITGSILIWDPPRIFEHEWNLDPGPYHPEGERSIVRWELRAQGGRTLLTMSHRKLSQRTASYFVSGVQGLLDRLAAQLDGTPLPDWPSRVSEARGAYPTL